MNLTGFQKAIEKYLYWLSLPSIGLTDILEIIIISMIVYQAIRWVQFTKAWTLFKGILILLLFALFAAILQLNTILWLMVNSFSIGITAALIIFQPELRRALERLGRAHIFSNFNIFSSSLNEVDDLLFTEKTAKEIIKATFDMAKVKTGALIVIERSVPLTEVERTGIHIDGVVSSQLLVNIFEHNTPLHDGAVIVRGNRIIAATCYLPLSENMNLGKELGTRHRAAVGISEVTDSITIIVSEETGKVSVASEGTLVEAGSKEDLMSRLEYLYSENDQNTGEESIFNRWRGLLRNERGKKEE